MAASPIFSAIADPHRRGILEFLRPQARTAGEIAARFDISWPAISRHLRLLRQAGLVVERRVGRSRRYTLAREVLTGSVGGWLASFGPVPRDLASLPNAQGPIGREAVS